MMIFNVNSEEGHNNNKEISNSLTVCLIFGSADLQTSKEWEACAKNAC